MAIDQITIDESTKYVPKYIRQFFLKSAYAQALANSDIEFSADATTISIAEPADDGTFNDYGTDQEFTGGDGGGVPIHKYPASFDIGIQRRADAVANAGLNVITRKSGVFAVMADFLNRFFSKYFDMVCTARIAGEAITAGATPLYHDELTFDTLADIQQQLTNNNIDNEWTIHVFVKASAYTKLIKEITAKNGLANEAVLSRTVINGEEGLKITNKVLSYGNFLLYNVPDDRMADKVVYDPINKTFTPDADAKTLTALIVPDEAAFAGLKWCELRVFVSALELYDSLGNAITEDDLNELNDAFKNLVNSIDGIDFDDIRVEKAGVYQSASADVIQSRIVFDAHAVESLADRIIPIYAEADKPSGTGTSTSTN
jgi:hypothetical protein